MLGDLLLDSFYSITNHSVCSTLVYKWVPANLILGMGVNHCDGQVSHLGGRRRNSPGPSVLQKLKMGIGLMGQ